MSAAGYQLFDHTADLGVRVWAPDLAGLIAPAAEGLYATIGELHPLDGGNPAAGDPLSIAFDGTDSAMLLRDFLAELLLIFDSDGRIITHLSVSEFTPSRLCVTGRSSPLDEERSNADHEVKAVTYHELSVREVPGGFEATYIVDI